MRYVRYLCIAVFAIALVAVALANRNYVSVQILPNEIAGQFVSNPTFSLPLFIIIYGGILAGLILGLVWEWVREHDQRAAAAKTAREMRRLEREVARLQGAQDEGKDEVLALLDRAS